MKVVLLLVIFLSFDTGIAANKTITVYTARNEHLIKGVFDRYQKISGVKINYITDKAGVLLERLKTEGPKTPADLLITVDAGNLWQAKTSGLLATFNSNILKKNIPKNYRDPDNTWFGLSVRARTIVYNPKKVKASELTTYEDLSSAKWKNRLCLRTSKKVYNQSLIASMIADMGPKKTSTIVKGWVSNLATDVFSSDSKMMEAIAKGQCDVGIGNTYYFGRLKKKDSKIPLKLFWPNQQSTGVHVNISGGALLKHSKNKKLAQDFLTWLTTPVAQSIFSESNMEYPVNPNVKPVGLVANWGTFKANPINLTKVGELQVSAIKLMDQVGYK